MESEEAKSYITKEQAEEQFTSKGMGGTALGLGIAGTALSLLSGGLGIFNGTKKASSSDTDAQYLERKQNAEYIQITKDYYENKLESLRELTNSFYTLDQKIQNAKDVAAAENRESFDALNKRIIDLEKSDAVMKATQPLYQVINDLKLNSVNVAAQNGIAGANAAAKTMIEFEAERRRCGDNTIVNYANATFYPKMIAGLEATSYTTNQPTYNPLLPPSPSSIGF